MAKRKKYTLSRFCPDLKHIETFHETSLQGFAERARFELAEELPLRQFSKLVVSATHPPLRGFISEIGGKNTLFFDMAIHH